MGEGACKIDLSKCSIACPICGERVYRIDEEHARLHGMTVAKFREGFGFTTVQERSREKLKMLYRPSFKKRTVWMRDGYITLDSGKKDSTVRFPMNNSTINRHLNGTAALAVYPYYQSKTCFFAFDVDTKELAKYHARLIVQTLLDQGIWIRHIHVSYSGSKGYHVDLFFDRYVDIKRALEFGRYVRAQAGLATEAIEFRPDGRALKLPLTAHPKTGNFAYFCDPLTMEPLGVQESHDYLAAIVPMEVDDYLVPLLFIARGQLTAVQNMESVSKMQAIQTRPHAVKVHDERIFHSTEDKRKAVERAMSEGLPSVGSRWYTAQAMVPYLFHEYGWEPVAILEYLNRWTKDQIDAGKVETPFDECCRQNEELVTKWLPKTDGFYATVRELLISEAEIYWVLSVLDRTKGKKKTSTARDLLWAMLLLSKAYANRDGIFFSSYGRINALFHPKRFSTETINENRKWLEELGYVEMIVPKDQYRTRKATRYRLKYDGPKDSQLIGEINFSDEMDCRALLRTIAAKMYDAKQLKELKLAS